MSVPVDYLPEPCATCPYRRSVQLALWSIREYEKLEEHDRDIIYGACFGCHGDAKLDPSKRRPCVGWLLDQKRRGIPSLQLRIKLMRNNVFADYFDKLKDLGKRVLYRSIGEMFEANYPGRKPRPMTPRKKT